MDQNKNKPQNKTDQQKRNQREKNRTKKLRNAFEALRNVTPDVPPGKSSQIKVLRNATDYIAFLGEVNDNAMDYQWLFQGREHMDLQEIFKIWKMHKNGCSQQNSPNTHCISSHEADTSEAPALPDYAKLQLS